MGSSSRLAVLVALLVTVIGAEECVPPIPGCTCQSQTIMCRNLEQFPSSVPETTTELIIDLCKSNFNNNTISRLPYTSVTKLLVRSCYLESVQQNAFASMTKLTTLDLTNNTISVWRKQDLEGLSELVDISLSTNRIKHIVDALFENTPKLGKLNLNGNTGLLLNKESFSGIEDSLRELYLEQTGLAEIPLSAISKLSSLTKLDLNSNGIANIPDGVWGNMATLEDLSMDKCKLGEDSISTNTFNNLVALKNLNLGFNEIASIPQGAFDPFKNTISELYLEHNKLMALSEYLVNWEAVKMLNISDNPWQCDCSIAWMKNMDFKQLSGGFDSNVTCDSPEEYHGQNLHNVTSQLEDCGGGSASVIALAITIPIIIICAGFIGYYLFKIIQSKRKRADQRNKSVRYSAVYKDTVESTQKPPRPPRPVSEL